MAITFPRPRILLSASALGAACLTMPGARPALDSASLLFPGDLAYQGAFKLPPQTGEDIRSWGYGGSGLAYYPDGDPTGAGDGYRGSLFGMGHDYRMYISEISIPAPVISPEKDLAKLNTAKTLQDFHDVTSGVLPLGVEVRVGGLEYLPKQGNQDRDGLYLTMGHHWMHEDALGDYQATHWRISTDLSTPRTEGPWSIGGNKAYTVSGYIFEIPKEWADANAQGRRLAAGGFRQHLGASYGPTIFAYAPWDEGNPPLPKANLKSTTLLKYGVPPDSLLNLKQADLFCGGAWLTSGGRSAIVIAGSKGTGPQYYGIPHDGGSKGWNAEPYVACMHFYDPAEMAKVAKGVEKSAEPQPYARLDVDSLMFRTVGRRYPKGTAYDRERNLLYVFEMNNANPVVHVWKVKAYPPGSIRKPSGRPGRLGEARFENSRARSLVVRFDDAPASKVQVEVIDSRGALVGSGDIPAGSPTASWETGRLSTGVYQVRLSSGGRSFASSLAVIP